MYYITRSGEYLNPFYLKAKHLANWDTVIQSLSREKAQINGVLTLFPSHGKKNLPTPREELLSIAAVKQPLLCLLRLSDEYVKSD